MYLSFNMQVIIFFICDIYADCAWVRDFAVYISIYSYIKIFYY